MSYLEMARSSMPDMTSGIISLWFRDLSAGKPPDPDEWPAGLWTEATADKTMLPPNTLEVVKDLDPPAVFFWSSYGVPTKGPGGGAFFGPQTVIMPVPPPLNYSSMRMLLTFGDANQEFKYCPWEVEYPDVIDYVEYLPNDGFTIYRVTDFPPPYKPYWKVRGGQPVGLDGRFKAATMKLGSPVNKKDMVPQSFIGINKDGYITICLQTKTKADYKGYAFQLDRMTNIMATQTIASGVPVTSWPRIPGYWDGYQFHYKDISNEIMGAQPECFIIGGPPVGFSGASTPRVNDAKWHHLLFSFDISGGVTSKLPEVALKPGGGLNPPETTTACKAWLALDNKNYDADAMHHAPVVPNGINSPQLEGMGANGVFPFGPNGIFGRSDLKLSKNDIVPQNVWVRGFWGNSRDGLPRYFSSAGVFKEGLSATFPAGDFNFLVYSSVMWVQFGGPHPGPWFGFLDPPRPDNEDPAKDLDVPQYDCSSYAIPVAGKPIGVPVTERHLKHNTGLEMGELQIWANRTLDTSDVNMRRLFVDEKGNPAPLKYAEDALGKPHIKLHGSSNWKRGKNTGSTGVNADGQALPDGQFRPVAAIERFLPDPELGK